MLELHVLRSGDKGSAAAVRLAGEKEFLCVDCGLSGATFADACSEAGLIPFKVRAFLITHCHSNQVKGLKSTLAWLRKRGVAPTVFVEPGVLAASPALQELQEGSEVLEFHTKQPFWVGDVLVRPFRTFHNNEDKGSCYNFRFETRPRQEGPAAAVGGPASPQTDAVGAMIATAGDSAPSNGAADATSDSIVMLSDVGVLSREAQGELPHARLLAIETNYDTELLEAAAQADAQVRFAVDTRGNFSNAQAATVVQAYAWPGLRDVVAMYLSRQYNTAERATAALEAALAQAGCKARVACSSPDAALSVLPEVIMAPGPSGADGESSESVQAADMAEPSVDAPVVHMEEDDLADSSTPATESDVDLPVLGDVFADEQACAQAGFVDVAALAALWGECGLLPADSQTDSDTLLAAFAAAGLLDPRDLMPSDEGIEQGVWACYVAVGDDVCLRPVFFAAVAPRLWDAVARHL